MSSRYKTCEKCNSRGIYLETVYPSPVDWFPTDRSKPLSINHTTREVFCDCDKGREADVINNQMNHPEYESPFTKMTDEQIIKTLAFVYQDNNLLQTDI